MTNLVAITAPGPDSNCKPIKGTGSYSPILVGNNDVLVFYWLGQNSNGSPKLACAAQNGKIDFSPSPPLWRYDDNAINNTCKQHIPNSNCALTMQVGLGGTTWCLDAPPDAGVMGYAGMFVTCGYDPALSH
jgi:hypothetical protein